MNNTKEDQYEEEEEFSYMNTAGKLSNNYETLLSYFIYGIYVCICTCISLGIYIFLLFYF